MHDLDSELKDSQRIAALTEEDATLVLAGAGSGKTKVVVARIEYLIKKRGIKPDRILALAFNSLAAKEVQERLIGRGCRGVEVRTFHSFGRMILKTSYPDLNDSNELDVGRDLDELEDQDSSEGEQNNSKSRCREPKLSILALEEVELDRFLMRKMGELHGTDEQFRDTLDTYLSSYFAESRAVEEFETLEDYWQYLDGTELVSLGGHKVRSREECEISNFLHLNGVDHRYEFEYPSTQSRGRQKYKPDFYIPCKRIWIEHFCVIDRAETRTPPFVPTERYLNGMRWKRAVHKKNGTILVETYSWENRIGALLSNLQKKLESHGVEFRPIPFEQYFTHFHQVNKRAPIQRLLTQFLQLAKSGEFDEAKLQARLHLVRDRTRAELFLKMYFAIRLAYDRDLEASGSIDYADMITTARHLVEAGKYRRTFDHIVVDEFRDIALPRAKLINAIAAVNKDGCRLFAVGDDWQSINRFAGSDLSIIREMSSVFDRYVETVKLGLTFRFNQQIADASSEFIMKNTSGQFAKQVTSLSKFHQQGIFTYRGADNDTTVRRVLQEIIETFGPSEVLILGRYKYEAMNVDLESVKLEFPQLNLQYQTIHKSKGLEREHIIVLGLRNGPGRAFPCRLMEDPLLKLVLTEEDAFENAEERRVFYVALTRSMKTVRLIAEPGNDSPFILELEERPDIVQRDQDQLRKVFCPHCRVGLLRPNAPGKRGHHCTWVRFCQSYPFECNECRYASVGWDGETFVCANCESCAPLCPRCSEFPILRLQDRSGKPFEKCADDQQCKYFEYLP